MTVFFQRRSRVASVVAAMVVVSPACKREATDAPETTAALAEQPAPAVVPVAEEAPAPADEEPEAPALPAAEPVAEPAAEPGEAPASSPSPASAAAKKKLVELPAPLHPSVNDSCGRDPGVDTTALPFALKTADGKDMSMASLRGKVVLLNFWGTWCKPCLKELPEFDRLVRRYRKHGAVLVAIATDTEPDKVLEFARERKIAGKLLLGGEGLAGKYDSANFPFSFVVDDKGKIRGSYRSYKPECIGKIEDDLRAALKQRGR